MNRSMIRFLLSKLLIIEAGLLLIPLIVAFIYHEPNQNLLSISATIGILLAVGLLGSAFKPKNHHIYAKEGVLIVALCLDTLVLLWGSSFCFFGTNSSSYRRFL